MIYVFLLKALQTDELVSVLTNEWILSVTSLLVRVIEHGKCMLKYFSIFIIS